MRLKGLLVIGGAILLIGGAILGVRALFSSPKPSSPKSQPTSSHSSPDHTAPQISVTDFSNGDTVSGTITVQPNVQDDRGVTKVEYSIDGVFMGVTYAKPFSFQIDTTKLSNGTHRLVFKAYDAAGNVASSQELTLNVANQDQATSTDSTAPNAKATSSAKAATSSSNKSAVSSSSGSSGNGTVPDTQAPSTPGNLTLSADDGYTTQVSWTASTDNVGVASYRILRDGVQIGTSTSASYADQTVVPGNNYTYKVQALDSAGNVSSFSTEPSITLVATSIWITGDSPSSSIDDTGSIELGVKFKPRVNGQIKGIRFYKMNGDTGTHTGTLWKDDGTQLATATFSSETASGWQEVTFATPVDVTANTTYVASYFNPDSKYVYNSSYFSSTNGGITSEYLIAPGSGGADGSNGVYKTSAGFPSSSFDNTNYWVDVDFAPVKGSSGPTPKLADNSKTYTGYPGSNNTGVPVGKRLPRRNREVNVYQPNTTVENIEITTANGINVFANNAVVKNTRVAALVGGANTWGVRQDTGISGLTVQDSEFYGTSTQQMQYGINDAGSNLTVSRVNISCYGNGIQADINVIVQDSFVHDPCFFTGDHTDAFIATGGDNININHNTLHNNLGQTAAVGLFCDFSAITNATVNNNLLIGGGYPVYAGSSGTGNCATSHDNKFTNNKFSREVWPNGGFYGPVALYTALPGNAWTNNTWLDDGTPVVP